MHDMDISIYRVPENITPSQREMLRPHSLSLTELQNDSHPVDAWRVSCDWADIFKQLCAAKGMDLECGKKLAGMFVEAGLEDVHVRRYAYYMGLWDGLTDVEKKFAQFHEKTMGSDLGRAIFKVGLGQDAVSQERIDQAYAGVNKEAENWEGNRKFFFIYAVCGRKPAR